MGSGTRWNRSARQVLSSVALMVSLCPGVALARPWAMLAPAPLASDSSYAALAAQPADSLSTDELSWVEVQRDWRAARHAESGLPSRSIVDEGRPHRVRPNDGRFAALASRPFESLTSSERAWLLSENAAQRVEREHMSTGTSVAVVVLVAAAAAVVGAIWGVHSALESLFGGH